MELQEQKPSLAKMRRVLKRAGAMSGIARELNVTQSAVSIVLQGRSKSQRIIAACLRRYEEIVDLKRQNGQAA